MAYSILKKAGGVLFAASAIILLSLSFTTKKAGGEGFEIYLNDKLVTSQFGRDMEKIKLITINPGREHEQLSIRYYHCGKPAGNRVVSFIDMGDKVVKQWKFPNSSLAAMTCGLSDWRIPAKQSSRLRLYYSSSQLPEGRQLALIQTASAATAGR